MNENKERIKKDKQFTWKILLIIAMKLIQICNYYTYNNLKFFGFSSVLDDFNEKNKLEKEIAKKHN